MNESCCNCKYFICESISFEYNGKVISGICKLTGLRDTGLEDEFYACCKYEPAADAESEK